MAKDVLFNRLFIFSSFLSRYSAPFFLFPQNNFSFHRYLYHYIHQFYFFNYVSHFNFCPPHPCLYFSLSLFPHHFHLYLSSHFYYPLFLHSFFSSSIVDTIQVNLSSTSKISAISTVRHSNTINHGLNYFIFCVCIFFRVSCS